ncbi:uncharacterized protein LOC9648221 [Selaginella moellendorffii]|nr:uncharacterized protein LOC9648221 [Selaginella moellendorffii]|eukprot:XP_002980667.2 uncharacterized protein LOC9648221 [Selaginella moellendorffii]
MAVLLLVTPTPDSDTLLFTLASSDFKIVIAGGRPAPIAPASCRFVELDLRGDEASVEQSIASTWAAFGRIDALVFLCDHDQGSFQPVLEASEEDWDGAVEKNLKAAWLVSRSVARRMKLSGAGGSIVFVTSIAGSERGLFPGAGIYSTCIAGVHQLSKALAMELGKFNIRVNCVVRGWSESDAAAMISANSSGKNTALTTSSVSKLLPLERWADGSRDLASSLLYFVSKDSSFITGTTVAVDGGQSLVRPRLKSRF